jgi:hypothetical protein
VALRGRPRVAAWTACLLAAGCAPYGTHLGIRWDAREEIWRADESQVRVRDAQSRVFDTNDRARVLEAVAATFQDLGFQIEVLDETLGIVSGKSFVTGKEAPSTPVVADASYYLYDDESLIVFARTFRTWGPFWHRDNLVRLTVTVRARNPQQLIVRASAQYCLQPVESPEPYRNFFQLLAGTMSLQGVAEAP